MKKLILSDIYAITTAALLLTFMVSCTKGNQSQSPSVGAAPQTTAANPNGTQNVDGTTDGAGGNGLNGKAYESYIVDPTQLPAYKNILAEKMQIMNKLNDLVMEEVSRNSPNSIIFKTDFAKLFKLKKWYLAPVSLKALSNATIGVDIFSDPTQQLAIQTDNEVWIDSRPFNDTNRTEKDRADLLLHEFFMTYLLLFREPYETACPRIMTLAEETNLQCEPYTTVQVKTKKPLTKDDYARLRAITATVMAFNEKTTAREFKEALEAFSGEISKRPLDLVEAGPKDILTSLQLVSLVKSGFHQGLLKGPCYGAATKDERKECAYELKISDNGNDAQIIIKDVEKDEVLRTANVKLNEYRRQITYKYGTDRLISSTEISYAPQKKEGEFVDHLVLLTTTTKGSGHHELAGIALKRFVVFTSRSWDKQGSEFLNFCLKTGLVKASNIYDDTIVLTSRKDLYEGTSDVAGYSYGNCSSETPKEN